MRSFPTCLIEKTNATRAKVNQKSIPKSFMTSYPRLFFNPLLLQSRQIKVMGGNFYDDDPARSRHVNRGSNGAPAICPAVLQHRTDPFMMGLSCLKAI